MFPQFDILEQYQSRECLELKNRNKFPLLVLDDTFFTLFADWALECGFNDGLLFLLENDTFRFQKHQPQVVHPLVVRTVIDKLEKIYKCEVYAKCIKTIRDLASSRICMPAAFASLCSFVWRDFLDRGQRIHKSNVWASFRNKIVESICLDSTAVISDDHHHIYFHQFLSHTKGDTACLACWRDVRHVTAALDQLRKRDSEGVGHKSSPPSGAGLSTGPTTMSVLLKSHSAVISESRVDPYECLDILLECMRKLHGLIIRGVCSGPSPHTKILLAESFQKTSSIRHVRSADKDFARDCCDLLEHLLSTLQRECHLYLLQRCEAFRESKEYVALIASVRLGQSEAVERYLRNCAFLQDVSNTCSGRV